LQKQKYYDYDKRSAEPGVFGVQADIQQKVLYPDKCYDSAADIIDRLTEKLRIDHKNENFINDDNGQEKNKGINRPGGPGKITCLCRPDGISVVTVFIRILSSHCR
jgi:phage/plasmid-associated DNA primase